jgi:thioredoxin 1
MLVVNDRITLQTLAEKELRDFIAEKRDGTLILVFTVRWSGSAQILAVFLQELSKEFSSTIIHFIDAEQYETLTAEMGVSTLPTTFIIKEGKIIDRFSGLLSKKKLREKLLD